jgi:hypothetical protein
VLISFMISSRPTHIVTSVKTSIHSFICLLCSAVDWTPGSSTYQGSALLRQGFPVYLRLTWNSLGKLGWAWVCDPPVLAFQVLRLIPCLVLIFKRCVSIMKISTNNPGTGYGIELQRILRNNILQISLHFPKMLKKDFGI